MSRWVNVLGAGWVKSLPMFLLTISCSLLLIDMTGSLVRVVLRSMSVRALASDGKVNMLVDLQQGASRLWGIRLIRAILLWWCVCCSCRLSISVAC